MPVSKVVNKIVSTRYIICAFSQCVNRVSNYMWTKTMLSVCLIIKVAETRLLTTLWLECLRLEIVAVDLRLNSVDIVFGLTDHGLIY